MLELELVQVRQPSRAGKRQRSTMLIVLKFQFCFLSFHEALVFSCCNSRIKPYAG